MKTFIACLMRDLKETTVKTYLKGASLTAGLVIALATVSHHLFWRPELTNAQALLTYWPAWLVVIVLSALGGR